MALKRKLEGDSQPAVKTPSAVKSAPVTTPSLSSAPVPDAAPESFVPPAGAAPATPKLQPAATPGLRRSGAVAWEIEDSPTKVNEEKKSPVKSSQASVPAKR